MPGSYTDIYCYAGRRLRSGVAVRGFESGGKYSSNGVYRSEGHCLPVMFNGTAKLFTSLGQSPLAFDPLGNRNPMLRINYQKVSLLKESQEVATKWGLGRSAQLHTSM